jgi:hypothetical protein
VTCHTGPVTAVKTGARCYRRDPGRCFLAGASRAEDVTRNITSALPMDSLTIHGAPVCTSRGSTVDPGQRPRWAEADAGHAGSAGTMTRAAVIAPLVRPQSGCGRRQVRAAGVETDRRPAEDSDGWNPCKDASALGTAASTRAVAAHGGTGRIGLLLLIGLTIGDATVCTPFSTAGDGTEVRGHRCAGIETQPKQAPLTRQRTEARIGTAARRRSGGPSPGCWTSILAHNCAEVVARW